MNEQRSTDEVSLRRAPKYSAFMIVGGGLGAIVAFVLTAVRPVDPNVGFVPLLALFALFGIPLGIAAGALIALVLDRRSRARAQVVAAERDAVDAPPAEGDLED
ncbi:hypothetical protein CLV46_3077 [Diaminobutyricimonas aerilata]|uniref:Uncharacterized protein n=1 Tax=Diaminobutyricimonas aerilata TaxID=1162967 RepID=A0A2M9CNK3_9MICO|nr:hypothetical protein [Diaminobutyricimonas aerilata]PJJ73485.1 hypothetical protein CLV46_3077 [Diaminobutyricimonas aerilata]